MDGSNDLEVTIKFPWWVFLLTGAVAGLIFGFAVVAMLP